ncbi:hypothetical protein [Prauserella muralis]|uniref:hypothetical protein n=1 Tax=Prauserella muralis TaxID=588067 RepID=UPI001FECC0A6|nr:hypothetical protein [Prauserella muralis]
MCLVGDAAHLPSPMTGSGFDASAPDRSSLRRRDPACAVRGSGRPWRPPSG